MINVTARAALLGVAAVLVVIAAPAAADPTFEWQHMYDGGAQAGDVGIAVVADDAGHVVVAGQSTDGVDGVDWMIRKLDRATGDTLWTRRVPAVDGNDMAVGGMVWDGAGNLLIGGTREGCYG